jgi:hypothetical protein
MGRVIASIISLASAGVGRPASITPLPVVLIFFCWRMTGVIGDKISMTGVIGDKISMTGVIGDTISMTGVIGDKIRMTGVIGDTMSTARISRISCTLRA